MLKRPHLDACLNCGTDLTGPFCPRCGQRNTVPRLTGKDVVDDFKRRFLEGDSSLARTLRGLSRSPGQVAREYVFGMRARYVNPLLYCLLLAALFLAWNAWVVRGLEAVTAPPVSEAATEKRALLSRFTEAVRYHLDTASFLALPLFALMLRRLYRRSGFNLAENCAFLLFVTGHTYLAGLLFGVLGLFSPALGLLFHTGFRFAYFVFAAVFFYDTPGWSGVVKALLAILLYWMVVGSALTLGTFLFSTF